MTTPQFGVRDPIRPSAPARRAELSLRSGTDNDLVHVNIGRLLDRERNGAGDRFRIPRPILG
jgi:hypothetical protein